VPQLDYSLSVQNLRVKNWREVLNTDSADFGGSNVVNSDLITAVEENGTSSIKLKVPPLGTLWLTSSSNEEGN